MNTPIKTGLMAGLTALLSACYVYRKRPFLIDHGYPQKDCVAILLQ